MVHLHNQNAVFSFVSIKYRIFIIFVWLVQTIQCSTTFWMLTFYMVKILAIEFKWKRVCFFHIATANWNWIKNLNWHILWIYCRIHFYLHKQTNFERKYAYKISLQHYNWIKFWPKLKFTHTRPLINIEQDLIKMWSYLLHEHQFLQVGRHTLHYAVLDVQQTFAFLPVVPDQRMQCVAVGHPADEARVGRERYDRVALYGEIPAERVGVGLK